MTMRLLRVLARFTVGVSALLALLVGVPIALGAAVGWPLPESIPAWSDVRDALGGSSVPDAVILKAIALVGWFAWTVFLVSIVVEAHAWARGRAATNVPMAGPVQGLARFLVLSVLVIGGLRAAARPPVFEVPVALAVAESVPAVTIEAVAQSVPGVADPLAPGAVQTCTVKPRDSLWKLAEDHLGDGLRWREVWELNRGLPQLDGGALSDPDLVRPGWILRMPDDAIGLGQSTSTAPAPPPPAGATPPVEPEPAPTTTVEAEGTPPDLPATPSATQGADAPQEEKTPRADDERAAPLGLAGATLLAAGLVATITRLRRAQVRRRRPGHGIPVPTGPAADAEVAIRSIAELDRAERLDLALRALAARLQQVSAAAPPSLLAVLAGPEVEFLFAAPVDVDPGPFRVDARGRAWTLPAGADAHRLDSVAGSSASPTPCLVTIGRIDDRDLLIDLESAAVTAITGDPEHIDAVLWTIAAGVATGQWAEDVRVLLVGDVLPGFDPLERVDHVDLDDALQQVTREAIATRAELTAAGAASTLEARLTGGSWTPTVVVIANGCDPDRVAELCRLAGPGAAVVTGTPVRSPDRVIDVDESGRARVTPPGITAALPDIPSGLRAGVGDLVRQTAPDNGQDAPPVIDLTEPNGIEEPADSIAGDSSGPLPDGVLLVRMLGPVSVDGGQPFDRRKSEELVVYLAMHPDGADEQRLKTAVWPDGVSSTHAFNQIVSRARICLGTAPDGTHYLPRLDGGSYRLSDWVTTDVARLEVAFRNAKALSTAESIERLADALRLVRGQPFEGVKSGYEWAHADGLATHAEILVADAAHFLAEWHLDQGEPTAALWAAGQGLLASPVDEALFRDRMRAYDLSGNVSAIESVMRELCRIADAMEPYDTLHPETVELYEQLTRRRVG